MNSISNKLYDHIKHNSKRIHDNVYTYLITNELLDECELWIKSFPTHKQHIQTTLNTYIGLFPCEIDYQYNIVKFIYDVRIEHSKDSI